MQELTPHHPASWWVGFVFGAVGASLIVGVFLGLIPLVLGRYLGQTRRSARLFDRGRRRLYCRSIWRRPRRSRVRGHYLCRVAPWPEYDAIAAWGRPSVTPTNRWRVRAR
jgi:hypothetical protein